MTRRYSITRLLWALAVFAVIGSIVSCKGKKELAGGKGKKDLVSAQTLFDSIEAHQPEFAYYAATGKMHAQTEDVSVGFNVKLRMIKDSVIWLQAEKFGFEVGRALITRDTAFIVNRLNKEYYAVHFQEFMDLYSLPFNYRDLQRLLAGGTVALTPVYMNSDVLEEQQRLTVNAGQYKAIYWLNDLFYLDHGVLADLEGRTADLEYSDYRPTNKEGLVPYERNLTFFDGSGTTELKMQLSEIEIDIPRNIRFSIPSHYERVD